MKNNKTYLDLNNKEKGEYIMVIYASVKTVSDV